MPVIPAIWNAKTVGFQVQDQIVQFRKIFSQDKILKGLYVCSSMIECLPILHKVLGLVPGTTKATTTPPPIFFILKLKTTSQLPRIIMS